MSGVPYTFGTATTSIPLSNLDSNFVTPVTIGNASVALGNTITSIGNLTLTNPTIIGGTSNVTSTSISNGTSNVAVLSSNSNVTSYVNGVLQSTLSSSGLSLTGSLNSINTFGFKNRIINGAMVIDQRNAGASVTITNTGSATYTVDRTYAYGSVASKFSVQQNAGSVTPPVGFANYLGCTSLSAYSIGSGDLFDIGQNIEGYNIADLGWGTANAKTVTLSFQVYSSLTGTFGGALQNSAQNRSYPFSYTISSANTWTTISVTIAGDTTGTWLTTNGVGIRFVFSLGIGSTYSGTAGSWSANNYLSATGATSVVGTSGATFYITGTQLEVGTNATNFDYRPYGTELALCQRYYSIPVPASGVTGAGYANSATLGIIANPLPVIMRTAPTITATGTITGFTAYWSGNSNTVSAFSSAQVTNTNFVGFFTTTGLTTNAAVMFTAGPSNSITASAEL